MNEVIRSRQHPLCKLVRALGSGKGRRQHRLFVAEGGNAVAAALGARWPLREMLLPDNDAARDWAELAASVGVPSRLLDEELFADLNEANSATEVLALAHLPPDNERDEIALSRVLASAAGSDFTLILDGLGDPNNVGALLRSADAAGVARVVATPQTADAFSPRAVRSSAGSVFHLPPFESEAENLIEVLRAQQIEIAVAVAHGGDDLFRVRWPRRVALVLGHETRGVSEELESAANLRITIPMFGRAESLNVAAAGAVLLYAWRAALIENAI